ncbi:2,4-dichlorophenoxyacetate alpha-ketoglutarate dioxygenase [Aspergillus costaricaensis CBS 115574]|uniref:2,4-dichlorophenoxyacetate alpha-ketoglutarate dioxygenase n=1 Tax=Aspergillus costaricaensis CBS 115574 TaxID=1448317 RepID=A0ACD1I4U9_9EURO|nr:2,4-dichlorophenoxyacetate alpha-ketoglutarate dioxygenase [Aspergillus costaricaensis CBS 115574]RAK85523.1 2,4-dichlorophenoxyacetate alpha-ketoglutarate dioxygenase [Aspergillus costaricaensis CBS 115574]
MATITTTATTAIRFRPLHPSFGAECEGVDFSQPVPDAVIGQLRAAMATYGVLVFRATRLDDARHTAFARQLGEPMVDSAVGKPGVPNRLDPKGELMDIGNVDGDGRILSPTSWRSQLLRGTRLFHVDGSYFQRRAGYSLLRAHQLPPRGTGGATAFADTRTAYEDLAEETKNRIQNHMLWHSLMQSRYLGAPDNWLIRLLVSVSDVDDLRRIPYLTAVGLVARVLGIWVNMVDVGLFLLFSFALGRILVLSLLPEAATSRGLHPLIDGRSKADSKPVIGALMRHASQDKYVLTVDWQNNGDMIMWDNTCVMHRSCGGSYQGRYVRDMRRATIFDSA